MLSPPQLDCVGSMRQLGMHIPVSACHMHSESPSHPYLFVQRHWHFFAHVPAWGCHTHIVWAEQSAWEKIIVHVVLHSGSFLSHMHRDTASHVGWVMYSMVHVGRHVVPFHSQN